MDSEVIPIDDFVAPSGGRVRFNVCKVCKNIQFYLEEKWPWMNKIQILGLITLVVGFIVTGIGTFVGSNWNLNNLMAEGGPYSHNVGWVGVAIVTASVYLLTYEKRRTSQSTS